MEMAQEMEQNTVFGNTIKELLLSRDKDNIAIATEMLKTYPTLIDITFFPTKNSFLTNKYLGNGDTYGNNLNTTISKGKGNGKESYPHGGRGPNSKKGWVIDTYGAGTDRLTNDGGGYGRK